MNEHLSNRFRKEEEILRSALSAQTSQSVESSSALHDAERGLESGFTRQGYEQIEAQLSEVHANLKAILEKLVYSDSTEYFRLAKIVDHALEELRIRIHNGSIAEFQKPPRTKEKLIEADANEEDGDEISWKVLCRLEPELVTLWAEAKDVKDTGRRNSSFCRYKYLSEHFLDRLSETIGPWVEGIDPKLQSLEALELAKDVILETLPPCRNCKKHGEKKGDDAVAVNAGTE